MFYKHEKTKKLKFCIFYFGQKAEQIKATSKYLSTNNFLRVNCLLKHYVSDETAPIQTSKYSVHHA
jgi:hypothetical protein